MAEDRVVLPRSRAAAVLGLLCAVAAAASWRVLGLAIADRDAARAPQDALHWRADHVDALLSQAEALLRVRRFEEAEALGRRAVASNPLDGRGYRVLADVAAALGDRVRQVELIEIAQRRAPRDLGSRAWAAQMALSRGDAATAIDHYDRILRVAPGARSAVFPALVQLAELPGARAAIVQALRATPPWRTPWLKEFARSAAALESLPPVFEPLRIDGQLPPEESKAYLDRFVQEQRWDDAFVTWVSHLPAPQAGQLATPNNGGFEWPMAGDSPFNWSIRSVRGAKAEVRKLPEGRGQALWVEFQGQRAPFRDVRQLLRLRAGRDFLLQWRSRLDSLETPRGLSWVVTCVDGKNSQVLATTPEAGTAPWSDRRARFSVPDGCDAQWLELRLGARIPAETQALGTAWFDDVRIGDVTGGS